MRNISFSYHRYYKLLFLEYFCLSISRTLHSYFLHCCYVAQKYVYMIDQDFGKTQSKVKTYEILVISIVTGLLLTPTKISHAVCRRKIIFHN